MKKKIKKILEVFELQQKELAGILNVHATSICHYLSGEVTNIEGTKKLVIEGIYEVAVEMEGCNCNNKDKETIKCRLKAGVEFIIQEGLMCFLS